MTRTGAAVQKHVSAAPPCCCRGRKFADRFADKRGHAPRAQLLRIPSLCALCLGLALLPAFAAAQDDAGFAELGTDLRSRTTTHVDLHGDLRTRGELLHNLDLDRGLTPAGQPVYPVPFADPNGQVLTGADLRLRTDVSVHAPGGQVAVRLRLDWLDGIALGSRPDGPPAATTGQADPGPVRLRRAWAEALVPVGVLAAGRMGSHWGLGILTHGGDCADCDSGDAADRVALVTPLFGHIFAVAYDFSAVGPQGSRVAGRALDLDPSDDVRTATFAVLQYRGKDAIARRRAAGRATIDYGACVSYRWQDNDVPAAYLGTLGSAAPTGRDVVGRDLSATAADGWLRFLGPKLRVEAEVAVLQARIGQATLLPGANYRAPLESLQSGGALESEWGEPERGLGLGLDAGFASGDPAPGFGGRLELGQAAAQPGELSGSQVDPPRDLRADDFRFHADYRVDRILFRELIGTVTDARYLRPHIRWTFEDFGAGRLKLSLAAVASWAGYAASTPGGATPLGVEIDPTLSYTSRDGFGLEAWYAVLFPLSGLDNPAAGLPAQPASLVQVRLHYRF